MYKSALQYLTHVIGLCQTPEDLWLDEDRKILREAGEFIQKQETDFESKCEEKNQGTFEPSGGKSHDSGSNREV